MRSRVAVSLLLAVPLIVAGPADATQPVAEPCQRMERIDVPGEAGNHVDGLYDDHPDRLRPILPCYREAFVAM